MCDFRREFPLGEGFDEWERAFTERIPALGEGPESSSVQDARRPVLKKAETTMLHGDMLHGKKKLQKLEFPVTH
jgi:hypothetical protein